MLTPFSDLVPRYRVIFFDAYGVLKNARGVLQGVPDLLSWLVRQGKDFYVITNDASRSPAQMAAAYVHPEHGILIPESKNICIIVARKRALGLIGCVGDSVSIPADKAVCFRRAGQTEGTRRSINGSTRKLLSS